MIRVAIAKWLAPDRELALDARSAGLDVRQSALDLRAQDLDLEVNNRVADIVMKMDPFEPFLKKYNVIFSKEYPRPEDKLDSVSQLKMFMWAYGMYTDPSFRYLTSWIINTQGNATLRKGKTDPEWFFGRSAIVTIGLFVDEVGRLASHYKEILAKAEGETFDETLTVE